MSMSNPLMTELPKRPEVLTIPYEGISQTYGTSEKQLWQQAEDMPRVRFWVTSPDLSISGLPAASSPSAFEIWQVQGSQVCHWYLRNVSAEVRQTIWHSSVKCQNCCDRLNRYINVSTKKSMNYELVMPSDAFVFVRGYDWWRSHGPPIFVVLVLFVDAHNYSSSIFHMHSSSRGDALVWRNPMSICHMVLRWQRPNAHIYIHVIYNMNIILWMSYARKDSLCRTGTLRYHQWTLCIKCTKPIECSMTLHIFGN